MNYYIWDVEHSQREIYFTITEHKMWGEEGMNQEFYDDIINQYPDYQLIEFTAGFLYYMRYRIKLKHTK